MAKQPVNSEQFLEMPWPASGLDVTDEFAMQAARTTTIGVNVRTFEAITRRGRGGVRPGINRYIDARVGGLNSPIQHLNFIVDPQEMALNAPDETVGVDYILDPSTNNLRIRNPFLGEAAGTARSVRRKGSARQTNRNRPSQTPQTPQTPIIDWPDQGNLNLHVPLGIGQLNAQARRPSDGTNVPGAYAYNPDFGATLGLGARQLDVAFTPTNATLYNSATGSTFVAIVSDGSDIGGHGTNPSTVSSDSASISPTGVTLALDGEHEVSYGSVTCVSRDPLAGIGGPLPGIGQLISIVWRPATNGSVFPDGGTFYWDFVPS